VSIRVAVVQKPPVLLDRQATIDRALGSLEEATAHNAKLVVFPEAYLPGYPTWIWRLRPGGDMALSGEIHAKLRENAVDIDGGGLDRLCKAARAHGTTIVCGMT
jgi:nitrilase